MCPELVSSLLFMECMDDNEAIIIQGYEQFSETTGYGPSFTYVGDHRDPAQVGNKTVIDLMPSLNLFPYPYCVYHRDRKVFEDIIRNHVYIYMYTSFLSPICIQKSMSN